MHHIDVCIFGLFTSIVADITISVFIMLQAIDLRIFGDQ